MRKSRPTKIQPTGDNIVRAVIYCRVSTKEQTQNLSLATQERICRAYCDREKFVVADVFVEQGESAKTTDRTKLLELLDYCLEKKDDIKHVVVYRIDRFSRQQYDYIFLAAQLKNIGATLKSAMEPISDDSTGKLMENILSAFAQFDNDVRAERTVAAMRAALEAGQWSFGAPISYRRTTAPTDKLDPISGPLVKMAFELMASGLHAKTEVLRRVTAMGLRTRTGKKLSARFKNYCANRSMPV